jgi:GH3 auxin-responsive promoter
MTGWAAILDAAAPEYAMFRGACAQPRAAQLALLRRILRANAQSEFGRAHDFARLDDLASFRAAVPIRGYDDMAPWMDRAADGEARVLTSDPVVAFEETGGSTRGRKLIPYTAAALAAFRAAVLPWLGDLARQRPGAVAGRAYVAVSPAGRARRFTRGGAPIGLVSEGAYLGADLVPAFAAIQAVAPQVGEIADAPAWRFATLLHLLGAEDLTFVSVWSPTFLIDLVEALPPLAASLAKALHDGDQIPPNPQRARLLEHALGRQSVDTRALWPRLDTISAWTDGPSRVYADRLAEMFPGVHLQPKGLLATESPVTIPWSGGPCPVPALTSCVIELIDAAGGPLLCDELHAGQICRVVITTPGGLYRYDLGDRVRCQTIVDGCPRLEFIGRAGIVSDLVGEKLDDAFVVEALRGLDHPASLLARPLPHPHYELLVDTPQVARLAPTCEQVERNLRANPQYAYARAIGQLGPLVARAVPGLARRMAAALQARGQRAGDIKPAALICDPLLVAQLAKLVDDDGEIRHAFAHNEQSSTL